MAGEEPRQLAVAGLARHPAQGAAGAAALGLLVQATVPVRPGRHLGQVRHRQYLMGLAEFRHGLAHGQGRLAAQPRIHLVQHQRQAVLHARPQGKARAHQGQHEAAQFTTGGDLGQGPEALAGVRLDPDGQRREALGRHADRATALLDGTARFLREGQPQLDPRPLHAQPAQALLHLGLQLGDGFAPAPVQGLGHLPVGLRGLRQSLLQFLHRDIAGQQGPLLVLEDLLARGQLLGFAAVAAGQALVEGQAGLHDLDAVGAGLGPAQGLVLGQGQEVLQLENGGAEAILLGDRVRPVGHGAHQGLVGQLHLGNAVVQGLRGLPEGLFEMDGVAQGLAVGLELGPLAGLRRQLLQIRQGLRQLLQSLLALGLAAASRLEGRLRLAHGGGLRPPGRVRCPAPRR